MLQKIRSNDSTAEFVGNLVSPYIPNPRRPRRSPHPQAPLRNFKKVYTNEKGRVK